MDEGVTVAVARGTLRRGAVAQALALIAQDLRHRMAPQVLITPNLDHLRRPLASTHAETLSATIDALLALGAREVAVAGGAADASAGFERLGYTREAFGRPVRFVDLHRDEPDWEPLDLTRADGATIPARVSGTVARSVCRVSLALAKTHGHAGVTLSLMNMLSVLHPSDSPDWDGGSARDVWPRVGGGRMARFLEPDQLAAGLLARAWGGLRSLGNPWQGRRPSDPSGTPFPLNQQRLSADQVLQQNLVAVLRRVLPQISVVDGFVGMDREGPRRGRPVPLRTVIAGTDAVAVDAVACAVMGFDPGRVGYLQAAQRAGLGVADLARITVVGDSIESVRRPFASH
jgi:uncharacterized protein (DUF362 family)